MSKLRLFHQEILEEEGMKNSDLPIELQRRIKGFDLLKSKYEKNPDDEKQFILLQKNAVKLGDAIQNFIENDYDDEDEDEDEDDAPKGKSEKSQSSERSVKSVRSESSSNKAPKKTLRTHSSQGTERATRYRPSYLVLQPSQWSLYACHNCQTHSGR
jgi:hypothetical protein